jgi:ATP-dependent Clp protease adaptor protein ClpS
MKQNILLQERIVPEEETVPEKEVQEAQENQLILYNDDVNTFDHVIACLMRYCEHDELQAEQCSLIVHYNGKCTVKKGSFDDLRPICEALIDNELSATIE